MVLKVPCLQRRHSFILDTINNCKVILPFDRVVTKFDNDITDKVATEICILEDWRDFNALMKIYRKKYQIVYVRNSLILGYCLMVILLIVISYVKVEKILFINVTKM